MTISLALDEDAEENEIVMEQIVLGPTAKLVFHQLVTGVDRPVHPLFMYPEHE